MREERRAVDAREHRPARVAAPVGAGDGLQLERADAPRRRRVRAAAEVGEAARCGRARPSRRAWSAREVLDELDLVGLVLGAEALERRGDRHVLAHERLVGGDVLAHPLLDRGKSASETVMPGGELEVVVEALLDRRPDRDLHAREELEHRGGQDVRRVVADEVQGVAARSAG